MTKPKLDIAKLAPTLSGKERAKLALSDGHQKLETGKGIFSDSEMQILRKFEDRLVCREYNYYILLYLFTWLILLPQITEAELRIALMMAMFELSLEKDDFKQVRDALLKLKREIKDILTLKAVLKKIENEIDGVPVLKKETIKRMGEIIEYAKGIITAYNKTILALATKVKVKESDVKLKIEIEEPTEKEIDDKLNKVKEFVKIELKHCGF